MGTFDDEVKKIAAEHDERTKKERETSNDHERARQEADTKLSKILEATKAALDASKSFLQSRGIFIEIEDQGRAGTTIRVRPMSENPKDAPTLLVTVSCNGNSAFLRNVMNGENGEETMPLASLTSSHIEQHVSALVRMAMA